MFQGENKDGSLYFADCEIEKLAKKYGTPLYVISEDSIRLKCKEIRKSFLNKYPKTRAFYASKAFLTIEMCRIVMDEGLGIDVVSGGELFIALKSGFSPENIIFHGNNKTMDEIIMAISSGVARIVVDSIDELILIDEVANRYNKKVNILFRITPNIECKTHQYISTGQEDSKFGIPLNEAIIKKAIGIVMKSTYISFKGLHFHVGSQLFENTSHIKAIDNATSLMKRLKEEIGMNVEELNVGGGFGIKYVDNDEARQLNYFVDDIMKTIKKRCKEYNLNVPVVLIEPGRWIVGEAGMTLYTVGTIKEIPDIRTYVSVDGGLSDNPRTALYNAKYDGYIVSKLNEPREKVVTIAGKCCESGDILIWDLMVPSSIKRGDVLAVMSTGAYNYSMASNYNKIPRPAVIMVSQGKDRVIVKRESYEDLIAMEVI